MKSRTKNFLLAIHIMAWVIFVGLCIKTGAILTSYFISLFVNPVAAGNLYRGLDLSGIYKYSQVHYHIILSLIILLSAFKAYIFYFMIKIFRRISFIHPFSVTIYVLIAGISYVALMIGAFTLAANKYCDWLVSQGVSLPDLHNYLGGGAEFLLLGAIIFMIAQVFKRGIEIQSEHELTI